MTLKLNKAKTKKTKRKISKSSAKDKAWKACSIYIRTKYSTNDNCTCVTCGITKPIKEMQAGHFVPGRTNSILFDERNIHPQCEACNIFQRGNLIEYYPFMLEKYGQEVIDELKRNKKKTVKYSTQDYLEIEERFRKLTEEWNHSEK